MSELAKDTGRARELGPNETALVRMTSTARTSSRALTSMTIGSSLRSCRTRCGSEDSHTARLAACRTPVDGVARR